MLIEFSVENYRSFKERVTLSMTAVESTTDDEDKTFVGPQAHRLLRCAAIFGANGSGKSNLFKALSFMRTFVLNSSKDGHSTDDIPVLPFRFSTRSEQQASRFEVVCFVEQIQYRYSFSATATRITAESLAYYAPESKSECLLFERSQNHIRLEPDFQEGEGLAGRTRDNALFLSVVDQFNGQTAQKLMAWFKELRLSTGLEDGSLIDRAVRALGDEDKKTRMLQLLRKADFLIQDIVADTTDISGEAALGEVLRRVGRPSRAPGMISISQDSERKVISVQNLHTAYQKFDGESRAVGLEPLPWEYESEGTKKFFGLSALLLEALDKGLVLFMDEFDARLHPVLSRAIVDLFNSVQNENNAQLIIATHDTALLKRTLFRQDQLWFVSKDTHGSSTLYSLSDYELKSDAVYGRDYIQGKYGAIPVVEDFRDVFVRQSAVKGGQKA